MNRVSDRIRTLLKDINTFFAKSFYFSMILIVECNSGREGWKRINRGSMQFRKFDICSGGDWVEKSCDKHSLFWVIVNCCIPIYKYPSFDNCDKIIRDDPEKETSSSHGLSTKPSIEDFR